MTQQMMSEPDRIKYLATKQQEQPKPHSDLDEGWTEEELIALRESIIKFPVGCANRWESIRDTIGSKSQKDVIKKV